MGHEVAYDAVSSETDLGTANPIVWEHTCTGVHRVLVVGVLCHISEVCVGVTYNGVALAFIADDVQDPAEVSLWCLEDPAEGAHNISVTLNAVSDTVCIAVSLTGAQLPQPRASNKDKANGDSPSHAVSSIINDMIVSFCGTMGVNVNFVAGDNATERADVGQALRGCAGISTEPASAGGSTTSNWAISDNVNYVHISASFKPIAKRGQLIIFA